MIDATIKHDGCREVFRFFLRPTNMRVSEEDALQLRHTRLIPTGVKVEVWSRDHGRCVLCGSQTNLHFDHDVPYSKGGSSIVAANVRLLCAKHNLAKSDKILSWLPPVALGGATLAWLSG